jgi:hypothetical protein
MEPMKSDARTGPGVPARDDHAHAHQISWAVWEREMRRLRMLVRLLAAVLLALVVRAVLVGVTAAMSLSAVILSVLEIAALILLRQGRRLEPRDRGTRTRPPHG